MAGLIKNFLGYLKLGDEEFDDEEYEEEEEIESSRPKFREVRSEEKASYNKKAEEQDEFLSRREKTSTRTERTSNNKVVPIRTTQKGLEVCIMKPVAFEDSQDICDMLLTGRAVVVNLEGFDPEDAQRIMDFISGAVYAINGKLHQISRYIFIFSPDSIDISGDYAELIPDIGFGVPTLNKEF